MSKRFMTARLGYLTHPHASVDLPLSCLFVLGLVAEFIITYTTVRRRE